jgi:membrane protein
MARLRDLRPVLRSYGTWAFLKRIWQQISEDGIFVWASALAYSWLFSIFPFIIFLLTLLPYLPRRTTESANKALADVVTGMLGKAAPTINDNIRKVMETPRRGWLGIGICVAVWVASGGMAMTMSALDKCYDIKIGRSYYIQRPIAIALTLAVACCALLVILLLPIGSAVEKWLWLQGFLSYPLAIAFNVLRYILAIVFSMTVLAVVYYFGPSIRQRFQWISPGAIFSTVVWFLLDLLFRVYVNRYARYDQMYGTVGGVALLLLFFYIDGLVLLIGAEINSEIDFERLGVPEGSTDFTGPPKDSPAKLPEVTPEL